MASAKQPPERERWLLILWVIMMCIFAFLTIVQPLINANGGWAR